LREKNYLEKKTSEKDQNFHNKCNRLWELCKNCYDKFGVKPEDPCWEHGEFDPFFAWLCRQYEDLPTVLQTSADLSCMYSSRALFHLMKEANDPVGGINFVQKTQAQTLECEKYKSILMKFTYREKYSVGCISTSSSRIQLRLLTSSLRIQLRLSTSSSRIQLRLSTSSSRIQLRLSTSSSRIQLRLSTSSSRIQLCLSTSSSRNQLR
jgi:hypothetical protein